MFLNQTNNYYPSLFSQTANNFQPYGPSLNIPGAPGPIPESFLSPALPMIMALFQSLLSVLGGNAWQPSYGSPDGSPGLSPQIPNSFDFPSAPESSSGSGEGGRLTQDPNGGEVCYTTPGGYTIKVNRQSVNILSPQGEPADSWARGCCDPCAQRVFPGQAGVNESGDPHESVFGAADPQGVESTWNSNNRVIYLGDGSIVDMEANPGSGRGNGQISGVNIFDGNRQINLETDSCQNQILEDSVNDPFQQMMDESALPRDNQAFFGPEEDGRIHFDSEQGSPGTLLSPGALLV